MVGKGNSFSVASNPSAQNINGNEKNKIELPRKIKKERISNILTCFN